MKVLGSEGRLRKLENAVQNPVEPKMQARLTNTNKAILTNMILEIILPLLNVLFISPKIESTISKA